MGDYVVHIDHGIGRFGGLVQRELDGHVREFLAVEYDGGGQLYVPVHQADRLTRYVGAEGAVPALDRLGGQEWQDKKGRVKQAVLEVAQEMCDRISIILQGKIIASGTVAEVRAMAGNPDDQLTSVFLKLTGGSGLQEIDEVL